MQKQAGCWLTFVLIGLMSGLWVQTAMGQEAVIYSFRSTDGTNPGGGLIFDQAGNLYTTTNDGGIYRDGTVFELSCCTDGKVSETELFDFDGTDGGYGPSPLTFDSVGNLYSTTYWGGANDAGTVFELSPNPDGSWSETVLYSFCSLANCADGAHPIDLPNLTFDSVGNLYGTASEGGANHGGVAFELTPGGPNGGWNETVLHTFAGYGAGADGAYPDGNVIFDKAGNLYGTTYWGGRKNEGTIFELSPNLDGTWSETVLHSFHGSDGSDPDVGLFADARGNLYGTTPYGGTDNHGTVFKMAPGANNTWTGRVLHSFTGGADGSDPTAGLISCGEDRLYGTASGGGINKAGLVFELAPGANGSWTETVLYAFASGMDGDDPGSGNLTCDAKGNLYGTTNGGGKFSKGTVYRINAPKRTSEKRQGE